VQDNHQFKNWSTLDKPITTLVNMYLRHQLPPQQRRHDDPPRANRLRARALLSDFERDGLEVYNSPQTNLGAALAALNHPNVVSTVFVAKREEEGQAYPVQRPVYYISEVLADAKTRYTQPYKLLYALLITSRKLRHYFQAHKIVVLSSFPLGETIRNYDASGRIVKWSVELGEFEIEFCPRQAIKS
jgi:hypothetical protein